MTKDFYTLTVLGTQEEIKGAKSVMLVVPDALKAVFQWRAGQHLTLRFKLGSAEVRRSYSISSSPASGDPLRITVKRVKGGLVSNHINDTVNAGDQLEVMPPFGGFFLDPQNNQRRTHYFLGAGSGVTPLFSMLHSVLVAEPYSDVRLAYGNASADSIIFNQTLEQLQAEHPDRFSVAHLLSEPSVWSSQKYWRKGRLDQAAVEAFINEHPPYAQDTQYYICGPGGMNTGVKNALMGLDVPAERIHLESYGGTVDVADSVTGVAATASVRLDGQIHEVSISEGQTVLEAVRAIGLTPPFSCQSGVCGACRATLSHGKVHMRARMALEDGEVSKGAILTCQSLALSEQLELRYEH